MTTENFVLAGNLFHCIKCKQCFGRLNKMDSTGEVGNKDFSVAEYEEQTDIMGEKIRNKGVKLLTTFLEGVTCNKCLSIK